MSNNKQTIPMIRQGQLSILIAGAVLSMAVSSSALAASITSSETQAVIGHAPVLSAGAVKSTDVNKDGVLGIGDTLTASGFNFSDADGDKQTSIVYEWHDGKSVISGTAGDTLTLTAALLGKTITVKAVANTNPDITEPSVSVPVAAATYSDINNASVSGGKGIPTVGGNIVKSVTISGLSGARPLVGEKLKADVTCHGTCDSNLTYQWQIEKSVNSGTYEDIASATAQEYTVKGTEQKRKIKVVVSNK
ncbi:ZirU family protein [Providencia alcalifaciens]|uniref:ZirU family protein n=1 Tax=Providencia alcalifaciens TaxID=126385 RepID=UPI001CE12AE3|nr:ZirU family protein [Providencia alcalifaciens]UBX49653.1 ZirU family protein [Providencia alcalifaciens]